MLKSTRTYTVSVPTKAYLRKFLYCEFGNPIKLDYNSSLGTLVLCLLDNESFSINTAEKNKESRIQYMNDRVQFTAPISTMYWKGHSLSRDKIIAINRYIENEFIRELSHYCKTNLKSRSWRPGYKDAIYSFCEKYDIEVEEDVTFEALKKAESRYRERKEKKSQSFLTKNVPPQGGTLQSLLFPSFAHLQIG